ncbi:DNA-binding transcriptional regulator, LysR family [Candidatus Pantoea varia]|uniref:DNA-binding transcriptional regulator, LysR family n=1 Tax=Candidatus Pantoea varia TaxID=1881036 RepID=A0A1I5EG94_9GAMM|nr:LysR family transcriptional regulator [Pantoea varia]SFO10400.1 DNA-binding transcriptional regulator, LysR family [Pantoea varia]
MDTLISIRVFCAIAELKSFTTAAERLGLSPAMASKHIAHLENRLSTRLLNRTSRHVSMTESGLLYFNQVRLMLDGLDEVESALGNVTVMPRGSLKLSAPVWMANQQVAHIIAGYHRQYPEVIFDIDFSGRLVNLVDEGFDLALRAVAPEKLDPGIVARPVTTVVFHLYGSPAYLSRKGIPTNTSQLNGYEILLYNGMSPGGSLNVNGPNGQESLQLLPVMRSESETMLHLAALEGMGLAFLPTLMVRGDLFERRLQKVLPDVMSFTTTLYAVYPSRKYLSAKVRTFIDFLTSQKNLSQE